MIFLAACNEDDPTQVVKTTTTTINSSTTTSSIAPTTTTTVVIGQFCDNVQAGETAVSGDKKVSCEFNSNSNRNQWVETPETTTTSVLAETIAVVPDSPEDPGPILCPELWHPGHHTPCPSISTNVYNSEKAAPVYESSTPKSVAGSGSCGGDLPPCSAMQKESGGSLTAVSPVGYCVGGDQRCHGKWQFDLDTWYGLGYSGLPEDAEEDTQDEAARTLYASQGCAAWSTC